jgi:hypothetical protein
MLRWTQIAPLKKDCNENKMYGTQKSNSNATSTIPRNSSFSPRSKDLLNPIVVVAFGPFVHNRGCGSRFEGTKLRSKVRSPKGNQNYSRSSLLGLLSLWNRQCEHLAVALHEHRTYLTLLHYSQFRFSFVKY